MSLKNLSIGTKMLAGFLVVAAIALAIGIVGWNSINSLEQSIENMATNRIPDTLAFGVLNQERMAIRAQTLAILGEENSEHSAAVAAYRHIQQERAESWVRVDQAMKTLQSTPVLTEKGKQLRAELTAKYEAWRSIYKQLDDLIERFANSADSTQRAALYKEYRAKISQMIPLSDAFGADTANLTENNSANTVRMAEEQDAQAIQAKNAILISMTIGVLTAIALGVLLSRSIVNPIKECVGFTGLLAQGDFSKEIPDIFKQRGDEIGDLARGFHTFVHSVRSLLRKLDEGVRTVASSATELAAVSAQTTNSVRNMSAKTTTVSAAAEEMSANISSVASGMEETSSNLSSVAAATEEMTSTISEIAANTERARDTTDSAARQVDNFASMLRDLGTAAQEIGKVTETIAAISSQTNLLALNATIEAARAGDAGRGFAVVANEIKELAQKTAEATKDIRGRIGGIQTATGSAVSDIGQIVQVIGAVNTIVTAIAASIEEQTAVTRDVSLNIAQSTSGVQDANTRSTEMSFVSRDIAQDVAAVDSITGEMRTGGEQVQASAEELSRLAEQLQELVGHFKI